MFPMSFLFLQMYFFSSSAAFQWSEMVQHSCRQSLTYAHHSDSREQGMRRHKNDDKINVRQLNRNRFFVTEPEHSPKVR